ncbi:hypothetical protein JOD45_002514 [Scopulibacillus daqui]|uniref:Uncharacterized protein n=1 Tax=Scopulibacillus daqui TaxID=1469162 RepID=A0ABS2Q251_9BACL|nr:hypothetical protein [Scopulibacillus daqui]
MDILDLAKNVGLVVLSVIVLVAIVSQPDP